MFDFFVFVFVFVFVFCFLFFLGFFLSFVFYACPCLFLSKKDMGIWDEKCSFCSFWYNVKQNKHEESDGKSSKLSIDGGVGLFVEDESTGLNLCSGVEHLDALN